MRSDEAEDLVEAVADDEDARCCALEPRMISSTLAVSATPSAAVGSSIRTSFARPMRRAGDGDALALAAGEVADAGVGGGDAHVELRAPAPRVSRDHPPAVEQAEAAL